MTKLDCIRILPAEEVASMLAELVNGFVDLTASNFGYSVPKYLTITEEQMLEILNSDSGEVMTK